MSFRNDGSCRVDDPGAFKNLRAYPGLQSALGNEIDSAPGEQLQLLHEGFELDETDAYPRLELYHHVNVALGARLAADRRPEQTQFLDTVAAAHLRERRAVDLQVAELECLVHGFNFIMPQQATKRRLNGACWLIHWRPIHADGRG